MLSSTFAQFEKNIAQFFSWENENSNSQILKALNKNNLITISMNEHSCCKATQNFIHFIIEVLSAQVCSGKSKQDTACKPFLANACVR